MCEARDAAAFMALVSSSQRGWHAEKRVGASVKWCRGKEWQQTGRWEWNATAAAHHANAHLTGTNREGCTCHCQRSRTLKKFFLLSLTKKMK